MDNVYYEDGRPLHPSEVSTKYQLALTSIEWWRQMSAFEYYEKNVPTSLSEDQTLEKVLDHGYARLVDSMGSDLSIVRNARVSYAAEWRTGEDAGKDKKLITYLVKNMHTSPFEAVNFTFEIYAPIFVVRQWHRHRTWSYNEISARYSELPEKFYIPDVEHITNQSSDNKQMRTKEQHLHAEYFRTSLQNNCATAFSEYQYFLKCGYPRELARMILPLSTYTHMFATVDLHNLMKFLKLRLHEHAQYEIQVYAQALLKLIEPICPVAVHAFKEFYLTDTPIKGA